MIEAIFELMFSFVLELVLEVIGEILFEFGFHSTAERLSEKSSNRFLIGSVYVIFGAVLGFFSLFLFPRITFSTPAIPILYFIFSPITAGFSLTLVSWLINRDIRPVRWFELDKFEFGVVFALGFALSRPIFG